MYPISPHGGDLRSTCTASSSRNHLLTAVVVLAVAVTCLFCTAGMSDGSDADVHNGTTGDCEWFWTDGTLSVVGDGAMADYPDKDSVPWHSYDVSKVNIVEGVTHIGDFSFCESRITSVKISDTVVSVGENAFCGCDALKTVSLGSAVKLVDDFAFANCAALTSIDLPGSLNSVGCFSFSGSGLRSVTVPGSVTMIPEGAFKDCRSLESIALPSSVETIGRNAFNGCVSLEQIDVPLNVRTIGSKAFDGCKALTYVSFPAALSDVSSDAFSGLVFKDSAGADVAIFATALKGNTFIGCNGILVIGGTMSGTTGDCTWSYDAEDAVLTVSHGRSMGDYTTDSPAPWGTGVAAVNIASGVSYIGRLDFSGCTHLTYVSVPYVSSIGQGAFSGVELRDSSGKAIEATADNLSRSTLVGTGGVLYKASDTGTSGDCSWAYVSSTGYLCVTGEGGMDDGVGLWDTGVTTVYIGKGVTRVGDWAFSSCPDITSVVFADGSRLQSVGAAAFENCDALVTIALPGTVTSIGDSAFANTGLTSFAVPAGVGTLTAAFAGCTDLVSVTFADDADLYAVDDQAFDGCSSLKSVSIPSKVTSIGSYAFGGCTSLTYISFPAGLSSVSIYAFNGLKFTDASGGTIGASATNLRGEVFEGSNAVLRLVSNVTGNCTWSYDTSTCTLSVTAMSGTDGRMADYGAGEAPWGTGVKTVMFISGVTYIGSYSFCGCSDLTTVTVLGSVGAGAFFGCSSLTSVSVPDAMTVISPLTFGYCTSLSSVTFGTGSTLAVIGAGAFNHCLSLTSMNLPGTLTEIGASSFSNCVKLASVTYPEAATIGAAAFCITPAAITINSDVTYGDTETCPDFTVTWSGRTLVKGTDYTFGTSGKNAGETTLTVTGDGIFGGRCTTTFTILKRSVTITSESATKAYDGSPLTSHDVTVSGDGFVTGEGATYVFTGSQTAAGTSDNLFTYTLNTGTVAANYNFALVYGSLEVTKRAVTLTSASDSKAYSGSALENHDVTVSGDGFVTGEGASYTFTGAQTVVGRSDNSFTYSMNEGTSADNYEVTTAFGVLEVTKRAVTLTSASATREYDGTALTDSGVTVSGDGFVTGEGASFTTTGTQTAVGKSDNTFTYTMNEGTSAANYEVTTVLGSLEVTKRAVTVSGVTATGKIYDGTTSVTVSGTPVVSWKHDGDDVTVVAGSAALSSAHAGRAVSVVLSGYSLTGADAGNYSLSELSYTSADVSARPVSLTSCSAAKVYDGSPLTDGEVTVSGDGFVTGEGVSYTFTGSQTTVGSSDNTFTYTMNEGTTASDYSFTTVLGTLEVTRKTVGIEGFSVQNKVYDGTTSATVSGTPVITGLCDGDVVSVVAGTAVFSSSHAGAAVSVIFMGYSLSGKDAGNYSLGSQPSATADITARPVTLTSASATKAYDGAALTSYDLTVTGDGFVTGQGAEWRFTGSQTSVGSSENSFSYTMNEGTLASDYSVTTVFGTLEVTKRAVTLTSGSDSKVYDGSALTNGVVTPSGDGFVEGQGVTCTFTGSQTKVGSSDNAFTYTFKEGTSASDYDVTTVFGKLEVTQKVVTVTGIKADDKAYDGTAAVNVSGTPALSWTHEGDDVSVVAGTAEFLTTHVGTDVPVVFSGYSISGADSGNYALSEQPSACANITKRVLVMTSGSASRVYDGTPLTSHLVTVSGGGFVDGQGAVCYYAGYQLYAGSCDNRFIYVLNEGTSADDYDISTVFGTLDVTKRPVTILGITAENKAYDGTTGVTLSGEPVMSWRYDYDDVCVVPGTAEFASVDAGVDVPVVFSGYTLSGDDAENYTVSEQPSASAIITPRSVTITGFTAENKVYDGTASVTLSGAMTLSWMHDGDDVVIVPGTASFSSYHVAKNVPVVFGGYSIAGEDSSNYSLESQPTATASITPRPVTVSGITAQNKIYDGNTSAALVTSGAVFEGAVSGAELTVSAKGAFDSPDIGSGKTVTISDMVLGGASAPDYQISADSQTTTAADIEKAPTSVLVLVAAAVVIILVCIGAAFLAYRRFYA